ncbi:MAG: chorismate mutase, partial [Methylacidiphilales bacterium]|nr:chorismate mutase [Candidatus Methylacidiphilales bacterium]
MDRIDLRILRLLQQRTKLSHLIGNAKRRHRAAIYVPERERDLLMRLIRRSGGNPPVKALEAIYREIFSSSRAAQGQPEIGLLRATAQAMILPARWCFGACDRFVPKRNWTELAGGLETGALAVILLTGADLAQVFQKTATLSHFFHRFTIIGDFPAEANSALPLSRRIFIVGLKGKGASLEANRALVLIKCKSTANAVKTLLHAMPDHSVQAETLDFRAKTPRGAMAPALVRLTLAQTIDGIHATSQLLAARQAASLSLSILGVYL